MASEIGWFSRRLLTSSICRPNAWASQQILRQPLWTQPRTFTTSSLLYNSPLYGVQSPAKGQTSRPAITSQKPPPPPPSTTAAAPAGKTSNAAFAYDATSDSFDFHKLVAVEADSFLQKHYPTGKQEPELRTRPATGRTYPVQGNMDFSRALRKLDTHCRKNRIKPMWHAQKFHERPGMKRKRLKSERHRRRFKHSFVATVRRVQELWNQGW